MFVRFWVQMKPLKFAFEIYSPLQNKYNYSYHRPLIIYDNVELSLGVETNLFVCLSGGLQKGAAGPDLHLVLLSSKHYHKVLLQRGTWDKQKIYL